MVLRSNMPDKVKVQVGKVGLLTGKSHADACKSVRSLLNQFMAKIGSDKE